MTFRLRGGYRPERSRRSIRAGRACRFGLSVWCVWLSLGGAPAFGQTARVSLISGDGESNGHSGWASVSYDGRYVAFESLATNLVGNDTNGSRDVFVRDRHRRATVCVSVTPAGAPGNGVSSTARLSADGRYVAFVSAASNLVAGDTNTNEDIFVRDRATNRTTRVSVASDGSQANSYSYDPAISGDGRFVAFRSAASNLVTGDTNAYEDIFVHDRVSRVTTRVSVGPMGVQASASSLSPALSFDGRYVSFVSGASNLVPGDTNGEGDVFVHDRQTRSTSRVSVTNAGAQISTWSGRAGISADGRFVAFISPGSDIVAGDTNMTTDVFLRDRQAGTTTRMSVSSTGAEGNGVSTYNDLVVSADGRHVVFESRAAGLVPGDTNDANDVFVHDRTNRTTTRVNLGIGGVQSGPQAASFAPAVSGDGRYVAYDSSADNFVSDDFNRTQDVFVQDMRAFQRRRVSVSSSGAQAAAADSSDPVVSADGRYVAFVSDAANLVTGDTNGVRDAFLHDRVTGTTTRVSVGANGTQANGFTWEVAINADGRYVVFRSDASNLVPNDTNGCTEEDPCSDVFVHDRVLRTTTRVSVGPAGAQANDSSFGASISADGRYVVFSSLAGNLVADDRNRTADVFVHDRVLGVTSRVSVSSAGGEANGVSYGGSVSTDGRYVSFVSLATNLVLADTNRDYDVFVHDRQTAQTTRVSVGPGGVQANRASGQSMVSGDGRFVVFGSEASNLVERDTNNVHDVFVHDRELGTTSRVSVGTNLSQAPVASFFPSIAADGRYVTFTTVASLVTPDTNGYADVYVHDRLTRATERVSLGVGEYQANAGSGPSAISHDGRVIAYQSSASNLVPGDTNLLNDIFVRASTPSLRSLSPRSGPTTGGTTIRVVGEGFVAGALVSVGNLSASGVAVGDQGQLAATMPAGVPGVASLSVRMPGYEPDVLVNAFTYYPTPAAGTDTDGDGMTDVHEALFSLDPLDPTDGEEDPDGDKRSSAEEARAGTHPRGTIQRFLAEGATSSFFRTTLALSNPGDGAATVLLRFLPTRGTPVTHMVAVPPRSRRTVDVGRLPGLETSEFSTVLEADRVVVLDRILEWDANGYGSHSETAMAKLSEEWYLAEGATHNGFDLFYLIQNPLPSETAVQVTYLRPAPLAPIVKTYTVAAQSRFSIWVDVEDPALANTDVSAKISASQPIAVERAMYLSKPGRLFAAGHESAGVTAPALSWFLAEGATGPYFDLFVLIANPSTVEAETLVTFAKPDGSTVQKTVTIAPQSRFNLWVDHVDAALADTAVSTTVTVTNGVPVVVERAMWWPGTAATWHEAHNSPGAPTTGTAWAVASGQDGGARNVETYVLVANAADIPATVRVTALLEDGAPVTRDFPVPPRSRLNVPMRSSFAEVAGRAFGVLVESVGLGAAPIVVESAVYGDAEGVRWQSGSNALATKLR